MGGAISGAAAGVWACAEATAARRAGRRTAIMYVDVVRGPLKRYATAAAAAGLRRHKNLQQIIVNSLDTDWVHCSSGGVLKLPSTETRAGRFMPVPRGSPVAS